MDDMPTTPKTKSEPTAQDRAIVRRGLRIPREIEVSEELARRAEELETKQDSSKMSDEKPVIKPSS